MSIDRLRYAGQKSLSMSNGALFADLIGWGLLRSKSYQCEPAETTTEVAFSFNNADWVFLQVRGFMERFAGPLAKNSEMLFFSAGVR